MNSQPDPGTRRPTDYCPKCGRGLVSCPACAPTYRCASCERESTGGAECPHCGEARCVVSRQDPPGTVRVNTDDLALVMGVMDTLNAKDYPMHAVKVNLAAARLRAAIQNDSRPT